MNRLALLVLVALLGVFLTLPPRLVPGEASPVPVWSVGDETPVHPHGSRQGVLESESETVAEALTEEEFEEFDPLETHSPDSDPRIRQRRSRERPVARSSGQGLLLRAPDLARAPPAPRA